MQNLHSARVFNAVRTVRACADLQEAVGLIRPFRVMPILTHIDKERKVRTKNQKRTDKRDIIRNYRKKITLRILLQEKQTAK